MELMNECLNAFHTEMVVIVGACSLTFREFCACGDPEFFGKRTPLLVDSG